MHVATNKRNKISLALIGPSSAPKLYSALQLAYGLCGNWNRIIVAGSSPKDNIYQHLGAYNTLMIPKDAPPQRYSELLNLCCCAGKEVVIFSTFSYQWQEGVLQHLTASYYQEVLKSHRALFTALRHSSLHILVCIDTRRKITTQDAQGRPRLQVVQQPIQQEGYEQHFTSVIQLDKTSKATVLKDETKVLPATPFYINTQVGTQLQEWCTEGKPLVTKEVQQRINGCHSLSELYQLLFELEIEDVEVISAFTRRRLELDIVGNENDPYPLPVDKDEESIIGGSL